MDTANVRKLLELKQQLRQAELIVGLRASLRELLAALSGLQTQRMSEIELAALEDLSRDLDRCLALSRRTLN